MSFVFIDHINDALKSSFICLPFNVSFLKDLIPPVSYSRAAHWPSSDTTPNVTISFSIVDIA